MKGERTVRHPPELARLKNATRATIKAVHGTEQAGEVTGSRQQRMSDCQLANTPDFLRLDEALALEEATQGCPGWPLITRALARGHGFELLPLPQTVAGDTAWHRTLAEVSREAGEVTAKIAEALANDHDVSATEIREADIVGEIDQAIAALARLKGMCAARVGGEGK